MHKDKQPDMTKLFSAISQLSVCLCSMQCWTALLEYRPTRQLASVQDLPPSGC